VETDAELEKNIGDGSYYLPSYFTALVGRGLKGAQFTCFTGTKVQILTRPHFTCLTGTKVQILTRLRLVKAKAPGYLAAVASITACFFFVLTLLALLVQKYKY
jgi:hypothetical protein